MEIVDPVVFTNPSALHPRGPLRRSFTGFLLAAADPGRTLDVRAGSAAARD
jgi:hypothetical protein